MCAAFFRKQKGKAVSVQNTTKAVFRLRRNFERNFRKIDITDSIVGEAIKLTEIYALRGYDAVQLATALETNRKRTNSGLSTLILVSADDELNNAAQIEGLIIENPNNYP